MMRCVLLLAALLAAATADAAPPPIPTPPSTAGVSVVGTQFRIRSADGRELAQEELPGLVLAIGDGTGRQRRLRIDSVERDTRDPAREVVLYGFSEWNAASATWQNACAPDPDGRRLGFPLAGSFTHDMRYVPASDRFLVTCTGGAEGKCVRFGYKPWGRAPDGQPLLPYYQACVRLVRADYEGQGFGHTRNGTPIDIFDRIGIQRDETAPGMSFEAAWAPDGAVCVRHTRYENQPRLEALAEASPRLAGKVGQACDETAPGLLFDRSFEGRR